MFHDAGMSVGLWRKSGGSEVDPIPLVRAIFADNGAEVLRFVRETQFETNRWSRTLLSVLTLLVSKSLRHLLSRLIHLGD